MQQLEQYRLLYFLMVLIGFDLQPSLREKVFESVQRKKSDKRVGLHVKRKISAMRTS